MVHPISSILVASCIRQDLLSEASANQDGLGPDTLILESILALSGVLTEHWDFGNTISLHLEGDVSAIVTGMQILDSRALRELYVNTLGVAGYMSVIIRCFPHDLPVDVLRTPGATLAKSDTADTGNWISFINLDFLTMPLPFEQHSFDDFKSFHLPQMTTAPFWVESTWTIVFYERECASPVNRQGRDCKVLLQSIARLKCWEDNDETLTLKTPPSTDRLPLTWRIRISKKTGIASVEPCVNRCTALWCGVLTPFGLVARCVGLSAKWLWLVKSEWLMTRK